MQSDATIIFYTSNRESPEFANRILAHLIEAIDGLPLITVSHEPMTVGNNICVGDVGQSNVNIFRQMMIGVEAAKTRYIITAEADFLQPAEFFQFRPPDDAIMYAGMPLYILSAQRRKRRVFCAKERGSEGAMVANRDLVLGHLKKMLEGQSKWVDSPGRDVVRLPFLFNMSKMVEFNLPAPIVSFRTANQLHRATPWKVGSELRELPHWGAATDLIDQYLGAL
jgi:hypothetical protein